MTPWRFADRGWFVNDALNLTTSSNRAVVAQALRFPNIAFGLHRWFRGGSAPTTIAIAHPDEWARELESGRPGDNLMLLSLKRVAPMAMVHVGDVQSDSLLVLSPTEQQELWSFLADDRREVACVHRFSPSPGTVQCSYDVVWDPSADEWDLSMDGWTKMKGELFFFDNEIVWQKHHTRVRAEQPPEQWTAQHGLYLVDGYIPDSDGRVVCGGPY